MKEERKLIGSIDFGQKLKSKLGMWGLTYLNYFTIRDKFDLFLKQSLEISMFIPCKLVDGVWEVLEEPKQENCLVKFEHQNGKGNIVDLIKFNSKLKEYQEAKERVLFEGFEIDIKRSSKNSIWIGNGNRILIWSDNKFDLFVENPTIEDVITYNLTLTEDTAKKLGV